MKAKEIVIFTKENGVETLDRKIFIENFDLGLYNGRTVEFVEARY